jgi:hypothetical protein
MPPNRPGKGEDDRYRAQAAEAVAPVVQDNPADAGASLGQMSTDRPGALPAEAEHDRLMAEMKAMSERLAGLEAELGGAKAGYAAARAALGPPPAAVYAAALRAKLQSHADANPDLPGVFDEVIAAVTPAAEAAAEVIAGRAEASTLIGPAGDALDAVDRFLARGYRARASKSLDFSALEADAELGRSALEAV